MVVTVERLSLALLFFSDSLTAFIPQNSSVSLHQAHEWIYPACLSSINPYNPVEGGRLFPDPNTNDRGGFQDAYYLAMWAVVTPDQDKSNTIFNKYFDPRDKLMVMDIFTRIMYDGFGNPAMSNIYVTASEPDQLHDWPADSDDFDTAHMLITIYEDFWVYRSFSTPPNACQEWEEEGITQDMVTLGHLLLHEYTHWDYFLDDLSHGNIVDELDGKARGWERCRALDKGLARYNAESYAWSHISQTDYQARRAQMLALLDDWLSDVNDEEACSSSDGDHETKAKADGMQSRRILAQEVKANRPNALLAWVGIFLSPKLVNKDDRLGLIYIISRMDWYGRLPRMLSMGTGIEYAQNHLRRRICDLYRAIISYEINVFCSHSGTLAFSFPSSIYRPREPSGICLETIKRAEEALPIFNQDAVQTPLMKQVELCDTSQQMEQITPKARINSIEVSDELASEVSGSLPELLRSLHADNQWPAIPSTKDDRTIQDVSPSLLLRDEYIDLCKWDQKDRTLLWIRGAAGEGKTILMRSIAQSIPMLSHSKLIPECHSFFSFNFRSSNANNAATALRYLIRGVLMHQLSLA
ncbi:hypothetical protein GGR57DRAFT_500904 [Xylariaceae sp. FL1272]|nr:hypothetical protein GGR57DRAFT_500904 [Xylariaceae sp. FL1272]